jgi:hypothetical protein
VDGTGTWPFPADVGIRDGRIAAELSQAEARQVRADAQKATEKNIKTASRAASKAVSFIPGVGGLVSTASSR